MDETLKQFQDKYRAPLKLMRSLLARCDCGRTCCWSRYVTGTLYDKAAIWAGCPSCPSVVGAGQVDQSAAAIRATLIAAEAADVDIDAAVSGLIADDKAWRWRRSFDRV